MKSGVVFVFWSISILLVTIRHSLPPIYENKLSETKLLTEVVVYHSPLAFPPPLTSCALPNKNCSGSKKKISIISSNLEQQ